MMMMMMMIIIISSSSSSTHHHGMILYDSLQCRLLLLYCGNVHVQVVKRLLPLAENVIEIELMKGNKG